MEVTPANPALAPSTIFLGNFLRNLLGCVGRFPFAERKVRGTLAGRLQQLRTVLISDPALSHLVAGISVFRLLPRDAATTHVFAATWVRKWNAFVAIRPWVSR